MRHAARLGGFGLALPHALACVLAVTVTMILQIRGALQQGYPRPDMDWNGDGWTSPSEFLDANDIGQRLQAGRIAPNMSATRT